MPLSKIQLGNTGRRNLIINGAMQVAQRGTQTGQGDSNKYSAVDRFVITSGGTNGRLTSSQSTDAPAGFANSLQLVCTTADTSIAAGELTRIRHRIEGRNVQHIQKGTSGAKPVTLSYHAKASTGGVIIVEVQDNDNNRLSSVAHTITTSYQKFTHTFPADTTGVLDNDNNLSFTVTWYLHAGSEFTTGTLGSAFTTGVSANKAVGQTFSIFAATSRQFNLAGVQLEVGSTATEFEHRSFAEELLACQRYYYRRTVSTGYVEYMPYAIAYATTDIQGGIFHPVKMRASPTLSFSGILKITQGNAVVTSSSLNFTSTSTPDTMVFYTHSSAFSGLTQFRGYSVYGNANDYMEVNSEL